MKKKGNWFMRILTLLFIVYSGLYLADKTGYYQKSIRDRTIMTEMQRQKFEQDVSENKAIDIINYLPEKEDYSNFFTKSANNISNHLGNLADSKFDSVWDFFKTLFTG